MNSSQYTDSNTSVDEGLEDYKIDGYHPVHIGEILLERYVIMQKLGFGHFSTAWLALDSKYGNYVCIKIQKSENRYIYAAYDEVEILQELSKHYYDKEWIKSLEEYYKDEPEKLSTIHKKENSHVVQLLNSFIYYGQNGKHFCMVFEVMGVTLLEIIKKYNYKGIPIPLVRTITKQILIGLDFLHRICHIIHTDMKPENILICLTEDELRSIQETGTYNVSEKKSKKKEFSVSDIMKKRKNVNEEKKRNHLRQIKNMERNEVSIELIEENIKKYMDMEDINSNFENDDENNNINANNFDIDEIIERPRINSVPRNNINIISKDNLNNKDTNDINIEDENEESNNLNDNSENEDDTENNSQNKFLPYHINLKNYHLILENYLKEKKRILHDINYRKFILFQNKILSSDIKNSEEKDSFLRDINNYFTLRGPEVDLSIQVKICDIGNACWFNNHFSSIIQTRQYRSPEVILGINYNETSDIWSLACIVYELVTGDFLFNPISGENFCKNDSHLAKFMEICGKMPKNFVERGEYWKKYFDKNGKLKRIDNINYINLKNNLVQNHHLKENEAQALWDFLKPMLEYYPEKRISARELLRHPWLKMPNVDNGKLNNYDTQRLALIEDYFFNENDYYDDYYKNDFNYDFSKNVKDSDEELNEGDDEDNGDYDDDKDCGYETDSKNNDFDNYENNDEFDRPNTQFNCINKNKKNNKKQDILSYI